MSHKVVDEIIGIRTRTISKDPIWARGVFFILVGRIIIFYSSLDYLNIP